MYVHMYVCTCVCMYNVQLTVNLYVIHRYVDILRGYYKRQYKPGYNVDIVKRKIHSVYCKVQSNYIHRSGEIYNSNANASKYPNSLNYIISHFTKIYARNTLM